MRFAASVVCLVLISAPCGAQIMENGTFDMDVTGWNTFWNGVRVWDPMDANDSLGSGSCLVTNQSSSSGNATGPQQCADEITGGNEYLVESSMYFPSGQTETGWARVLIRWYSDASCTTQITNTVSPSVSTTDQWVEVRKFVEAPASAVAIALRLDVWKVEAIGELSAHFDNVSVSEVVFRDDFEDGDLGNWLVF